MANLARFMGIGEVMTQVNVLEAKNKLSALLKMLETGQEESIVIARHGHPVAKMVPIRQEQPSARLGVAAGCKLVAPGWDIHEDDDLVAQAFGA